MSSTMRPPCLWCVGLNYTEHTKELGKAWQPPSEPLIFLKVSIACQSVSLLHCSGPDSRSSDLQAGSCIVADGEALPLPAWSENLHHEVSCCLPHALTSRLPQWDHRSRLMHSHTRHRWSWQWSLARA